MPLRCFISAPPYCRGLRNAGTRSRRGPGFRHCEHIRTGLADVQEDFARDTVQIVDGNIRHAERRVHFIGCAARTCGRFLYCLSNPLLLAEAVTATLAPPAPRSLHPLRLGLPRFAQALFPQ